MSRITSLLRRTFGVVKEHVGTDHLGNKYYYIPEQKSWTGRVSRPRRLVEAANPNEFEYMEGNIPSEWDAWIRGRRKQPPTIENLIEELSLLGLNHSLCNWILDFLSERPQTVRIRNSFSSTTTLSTGAPQGCLLSPLLFTLLIHDCAAMHSSNHKIKFADDMTVVGLISKGDESAYRDIG
ncbi:NADH dehydrogenase [ubiquinone] 1 alpha subcomplex assembly factor 2 isoform X1 [Cyprinus carpio]|uniref:NADH dehydrogenase [ubiquinone] 1 alpha subcomplex assembly factor 2 isoform X1 n=1 Tax=Cyprinus carpio TaxID=7962 RepID=A0A9R0A5A1_CYPCA|nr:NADH dehydrogenase [ubiquinone] 1 alpha subcomplex assembly factor 2 isoform X1 [Cyprinus carpio]